VLQSLESGLNACCHCFNSKRLGQPGDAFEQEMTVGEQSQQKTIHQILLPDDNMTNLLPERWHPLTQLSYFLRNFLSRFHTVCSDTLGSENVRSNRLHGAEDPLSIPCAKRAKGESRMSALKSS